MNLKVVVRRQMGFDFVRSRDQSSNKTTNQQTTSLLLLGYDDFWSLISCVRVDQTSNTRTINKPTSTLQTQFCVCIQYVGKGGRYSLLLRVLLTLTGCCSKKRASQIRNLCCRITVPELQCSQRTYLIAGSVAEQDLFCRSNSVVVRLPNL
jgi:hypothetical protein